MILLMMFGIGLIVWAVPIIIAIASNRPAKLGILLLDLFAGWTEIGWLAALIWSVVGPSSPQQVVVYNTGGPRNDQQK